MGIKTKSVLASYFETNDKPTQAQFADLIDTVVVIPVTGGTGVVEIEATASATMRSVGAVGVQVLGAATTVAAQNALGGTTVGKALFEAATAAAARATLAAAGTASANTFTGRQTLSGSAIDEAQGTAIASAATTDIGAVNGNFVHITGTTTITSLGSIQAGTRRIVTFDGTLKLTHGAVSLILPNGADITTAPGDVACFVSEGSGNWRCVWYQKANVRDGFTAHKSANQTGIASATWTKITFDTEDWDIGGNYDAANSRFLPITKGKYLIGATLHFSAGTVDQTAFLVAVYKNGALLPQGILVKMEASGTGTLIGGGSMIVDANGTTDYFEIFFNGEGAGTKTVDTLSTFWGAGL